MNGEHESRRGPFGRPNEPRCVYKIHRKSKCINTKQGPGLFTPQLPPSHPRSPSPSPPPLPPPIPLQFLFLFQVLFLRSPSIFTRKDSLFLFLLIIGSSFVKITNEDSLLLLLLLLLHFTAHLCPPHVTALSATNLVTASSSGCNAVKRRTRTPHNVGTQLALSRREGRKGREEGVSKTSASRTNLANLI